MNYEALIERDLDAIPAAAEAFLDTHSPEELWISVTRFAVLAFAPSQHAKRSVMACRATYELRDELGERWTEMIVACARYAAESRQPWSEPPILDPPEPSSGTMDELRAAMADGDRLRAERWLSARLEDAEAPLREVARGDALLLLDTALALLPHLGEKGRFALLRMPVWELVTNPGAEDDDTPLAALLERAAKGDPEEVQRVFVRSCHPERESRDLGGRGAIDVPLAPPEPQVPRLTLGMTARPLAPYPLARDYAQTLLAHLYARRLPPADAAKLLDAVHYNLEHGENFAEWSFA